MNVGLAVALLVAGGPVLAAAQPPASSDTRRTGLLLGVQAITRGTWEPTGAEVGLLRARDPGGRRSVAVFGRFGGYTFCGLSCDMHGWYAGLAAAYRMPLVDIADVGRTDSQHRAIILQTFEAAAYLDHDAPTPDAAHATLTWSLEITVLDRKPISETLILHLGPQLFIGGTRVWVRFPFGLRYQTPIGRRRAPTAGASSPSPGALASPS